MAIYGRGGVANACLRLQAAHEVDVPLLLFACWLGRIGVTLTLDRAMVARSWVADWNRDIVRPLRAIRTRLITGPAPAPHADTDGLRDTVKKAELDSERLQIAWLQRQSAHWSAQPPAQSPTRSPTRSHNDIVSGDANMLIMFVAMAGRPPDAAAAADLSRIAAAAVRLGAIA